MTRYFVPLAAGLMLAPAVVLAQDADAPQVERGAYLVTIAGCHDCHTPLKMGEAGPEPDMERALSGHPQDFVIEAPAVLEDPWGAAATLTNTAWSGPWGVSFTANITPDPTGVLQEYTEEQFIQAMRNGRHLGQGRQILPPMPWPMIGQMTDDDLKAVFAYLQTVEPVQNVVPDPLPPAQ